MQITTLKQAREIIGSLGKPSKMPGNAYGLPASNAGFVPAICKERGLPVPLQYGCAVGQVLARIPGTPCYRCYADEKGNYTYPSVQIAQTIRLVGLYHPQWVEAMVFVLGRTYIQWQCMTLHTCGGMIAVTCWTYGICICCTMWQRLRHTSNTGCLRRIVRLLHGLIVLHLATW